MIPINNEVIIQIIVIFKLTRSLMSIDFNLKNNASNSIVKKKELKFTFFPSTHI